MKTDINANIKKIVEILKTNFSISDIILFGSNAEGKNNENSDIDIVVVLNDNTFSGDYESRLSKRLSVSEKLLDIKRNVQIDSLVFTKPEWEKFKSLNSSFSREIIRTGISIL